MVNPAFLAEPEFPYGSPQYTIKEHTMYDFTGNVWNLPPADCAALVEYLQKMEKMKTIGDIRAFHTSLTAIPGFAFISELVPPPGETPFNQYHAMMIQLHAKGLQHYKDRYPGRPEPEHRDYAHIPRRQAGGPDSSPFRFLEAAAALNSPGEYAAFFQGNNRIPSEIIENTPENWADLFNRADNQGIAVNAAIPRPDDVALQGMNRIHEAYASLKNNLSGDFHAHEFSRPEAPSEARPVAPFPEKPAVPEAGENPPPSPGGPDQRKREIFVQNAYVPETEIPGFAELAGDAFVSYDGYQFARTENANQTIIIQKAGREAAVSAALYNSLITNTLSFLNEKHLTPEITEKYEQAVGADMHKTRTNTAANYWHNYRVLCREQASNPADAMEIAKSIIREMPYAEQEKFKEHIKVYAKTSRPPETYNQRIINFYHAAVKNMPIDASIFTRNSLPGITRTVDVIEKKALLSTQPSE
ncbi:MAG: hypothetical protein LBP74_07230 [Treponema sp.]|nr:hypothetical protein [Treponema sp.]